MVLEGAVVLASQDWDELFAGLEEAAALAHGLESAVQLDGPGAVTVAEEAPMRGVRPDLTVGQQVVTTVRDGRALSVLTPFRKPVIWLAARRWRSAARAVERPSLTSLFLAVLVRSWCREIVL